MDTDPGPAYQAPHLRQEAPLLDAWLRGTPPTSCAALTPFTVPGHKQRTDLVGEVVRGDVPLYGGLAPVKGADALLAEAERRAADLWGADCCRFSVAGSTHGNQALALAAGEPGRSVVVSRTLHRSLLLGLVLAGLRPDWVRPELDPVHGLPTCVRVDAVRRALAEHPDACAVMLGDPSYVGTIGDLAGHAAVAHAAGVPLIVDSAWAAHFGFCPELPPHPLASGADAMVTSAHKLLPACTRRRWCWPGPPRPAVCWTPTDWSGPSGQPIPPARPADPGQHRRRPGPAGDRRRPARQSAGRTGWRGPGRGWRPCRG